jgi:CHAD domain-containing protein
VSIRTVYSDLHDLRAEVERLRALTLQLADEIEGEGHKVWAREIRAVVDAGR